MNAMYFLLVAGILAIISFFIIFFIVRSKSKKSSLSRMCLENFLGDLADSFYDAKWRYVAHPPGRAKDEIASDIAKDISQKLGMQLIAMLSNMTEFPMTQKKVFSADDATNHFIDKMIPNLSMLYLQYNDRKWLASLDNSEEFLFKVAKIKTLEVLKQRY